MALLATKRSAARALRSGRTWWTSTRRTAGKLLVRARIAQPAYSKIDASSFSSVDVSRFRFFQFNAGNVEFFRKRQPDLRIRVGDMPHFKVAEAAVQQDVVLRRQARDLYFDYLRASWPSHDRSTAEPRLQARYERYVALIRALQESQSFEPVLLTVLPTSDDYYVVEGNHRCSVALALGVDCPARVLTFRESFDHFMPVNEYYGTGNRDMPYQSVLIEGQVVRDGRRDDAHERLGLLPDGFLQEKSVVDVGANIGMSSIAAFQSGARSVTGLELSQPMVNYATRFAVFNSCYPQVTFRQFDAEVEQLAVDQNYDVGFMFSVHDHLASPKPLVDIARDHVRNSIVFEGHPGSTLENYWEFLDAVGFSSIERAGTLGTSAFSRVPARPLWILHK